MTKTEKLLKFYRGSLERLYTDICSIYEYQKAKDPKTKITEAKLVKVFENVPCRISFKNIAAVQQTDSSATISQITTLFISPEIVIKENSKIDIIRNGRVLEYKNSGTPAIYCTHQEISLSLYKENA